MGAAVDHVSPMGTSGGSAEGNDKSEGQRFSCKNKLTALVVDNGGVCQAIQTALLRSYGVETEAVETGEAAVELIASEATFSLIIIEMFLPLMNGPETAKQIRAMGAQSKILGITAFFDERDQQEFLAAGADKYIEKPNHKGARQLDVKAHIKIARGLIAMLITIISYRTVIIFYVLSMD